MLVFVFVPVIGVRVKNVITRGLFVIVASPRDPTLSVIAIKPAASDVKVNENGLLCSVTDVRACTLGHVNVKQW